MPNPQSGGPWATLHLILTLWTVWHGWLYQEFNLPPA
jgi:hypothetical protein